MKNHKMILVALTVIILAGCGNSTMKSNENVGQGNIAGQQNEETATMNSEEKAYSLMEIENFDVSFDEIYGVSMSGATTRFVVYADQGAYLYSNDKIYTNGTHFNLDYEIDFTKAWIGTDREEFHNIEEAMQYGYPEIAKLVLNNDTEDIVCSYFTGFTGGEYRAFVNEGNGIRVYREDRETFEEEGVLEIPNGEVIDRTIWGNSGLPMYISDQNHLYYYGIPEDDLSNTYADVEPTYALIEDNMYEEIKTDFGDDILFYNGYLITKEGKCYKVEAK